MLKIKNDLNFHLRGPTDTILCYKKQEKIHFITTPLILSMKAIDNCDKKENINMPQ
jgi:hypothetical protein